MNGPNAITPTFLAKVWIAVGIGMLLTLGYWIAALHFHLPARETLVAWYGQPRGRVAPFGIWVLALGGPLLIHHGLVKLGLAEEL